VCRQQVHPVYFHRKTTTLLLLLHSPLLLLLLLLHSPLLLLLLHSPLLLLLLLLLHSPSTRRSQRASMACSSQHSHTTHIQMTVIASDHYSCLSHMQCE
jgi:hypothetical protein